MRSVTLGLSLSIVAALPSLASAQGLSAPAVGTGLSNVATSDPAAVYWNPSLLADLERPTLLIGGSLLVGDISYERERRALYQRSDALGFALPIAPESVDRSRTGFAPPVTSNPVGVIPTLFVTLPIAIPGPSRLVIAAGIYAPFAAILNFDPDGAQRWQLQSATIATIFSTASIAWRINDALSLGAGVSYVFGFAELSRVQDFAALGDVGAALARPPIGQRNDFRANAPPGVRELDVLARPIQLRKMIAHGITFNVGLAVRPVRGLTLAASYQHSADLTFSGRFELDLNDPFFTRDLASQGLRYAPRVEGEATLSFPLPRALRVGASWDVTPALGFGLVGDFVTWSQVEQFDARVRSPQLAQPMLGLPETTQLSLPRRWRDTFGVEATVRWSPVARWLLWATGGYHSGASPDETIDLASPDGDRIVAALGARYSPSADWTLFVDGEVQTIVPRTVTASDQDLGNGVYRLTLANFGLHIARRF